MFNELILHSEREKNTKLAKRSSAHIDDLCVWKSHRGTVVLSAKQWKSWQSTNVKDYAQYRDGCNQLSNEDRQKC